VDDTTLVYGIPSSRFSDCTLLRQEKEKRLKEKIDAFTAHLRHIMAYSRNRGLCLADGKLDDRLEGAFALLSDAFSPDSPSLGQ
jgi:hypothetical protein